MDTKQLRVTALVTAGHRALIGLPSLTFIGLPVPKIRLILGHGIYPSGDLDLSTSKWGHGVPVSCASFLACYAFPLAI